MKMNMYTAITLSAGDKAKARTADGATVVIAMYYTGTAFEWVVSRVASDGGHSGIGCGADFGKVREQLSEYGLSADEDIWLPVEEAFPWPKEQAP